MSFVSRIRFTPARIFHDHKLRMQLQPFHKLCGALLGFGVFISFGWIFLESCRSRGVNAILLVYNNLSFGCFFLQNIQAPPLKRNEHLNLELIYGKSFEFLNLHGFGVWKKTTTPKTQHVPLENWMLASDDSFPFKASVPFSGELQTWRSIVPQALMVRFLTWFFMIYFIRHLFFYTSCKKR